MENPTTHSHHDISAWSLSTTTTTTSSSSNCALHLSYSNDAQQYQHHHHYKQHRDQRFEVVRYEMMNVDGNDDDDDDEEEEEEPSSIPTAPSLDLNKVYAASQAQRGPNKARSMCSFTTERSAATTRISNTATKRQAKKQQKRRFLLFTKILMKLLERRDPTVHHDARLVIHDCEEKKKRGEAESVVESLRSPLKDVVGPDYWNEARNYSKRVLLNSQKKKKEAATIPCNATEEELLAFNMADMTFLHGSAGGCDFTAPDAPSPSDSPVGREEKIRKKRLWMIICVFMKYLMRRDEALYLQAKELVADCVGRHRAGDERYRSLSGSIQTCLKEEIGADYWKRSEGYVARYLNSRNTDTTEPAVTPFHIDNGSFRNKRMKSSSSVSSFFGGEQKRPRYFQF